MLKLIKCEFWKLKRKRLLYALMSLSLFFPLILAYMAKAGTGADTTEHYLQTRFDYVYTMMLGYGLVFLLPCLIGIIAAILFFIERDCDTSKNLRTIPVTNTQLNSHPSFPFCKRVSHFESDLQILYPTFHFCNDFPVFFLAFMI